jgi:hypothetical protein
MAITGQILTTPAGTRTDPQQQARERPSNAASSASGW